MSLPPLGVVTRVVAALHARSLTPAIGGSGLLVALGLAEVANDWDVTVDAPQAAVAEALHAAGIAYRDGTGEGGVYATERRWVINGGDHEVDLLLGFALRGPAGVEQLPTRVSGRWRGLPIGDPAVWARAYLLLERPAKAEVLYSWLRSNSVQVCHSRPFYSTCADVYDLLVTDPVGPWLAAVESMLEERREPRVLDAGCGTGRHAAAFIAKGWNVELVDASPTLLGIAFRRCPTAPAHLADICSLAATDAYDAVTCRGVLNDLLDTSARDAAIRSLAAQLRTGGTLILDVREWEASRAKATGSPVRRTVDLPDGGSAVFTSCTRWSDGYLLVSETHEVRRAWGEASERYDYQFTMRPWSEDELRDALRGAGLRDVSIGPCVGRRGNDRRFVIAKR